MKQTVALLLLVATVCVAQDHSPASLPSPGYKLAWSDEFTGTRLDTNKWEYRTDSKMWSTQKPENISVRDGRLIIAVKKEEAGGKHYSGGGVISKPTFKYGYYEARFRVPPGAGWHTSFWMMLHGGDGGTGPAASAQELDVCENDSIHQNSYGVNFHKWNPAPPVATGHTNVMTPDLSADFHVYGCEFTPGTVKYFFDGKLVQTVDVSKFAHGEQNIWLTTIASYLGGTRGVDDARLPATAEFDYVRVYLPK